MAGMDVWGQGAIFAFSGLEGKTDFQSQLVGVLLGDHPGVRFLASHPFELYVDTTSVSDLIWETVASDVLSGKVCIQNAWKRICFAFRSNATVVGICPAGRLRLVFDSGKQDESVSLNIAEAEGDCWFSLSLEEADKCSPREIEETIEKRTAFFDRFHQANMKKTWRKPISTPYPS